jgi:hypothetical protein
MEVSKKDLCEMDRGDLESKIKRTLASLLAEEIIKELEVAEIKNSYYHNPLYSTYEESVICIKPSEYMKIIDSVRKHNYDIVDEDGNIISLSNLL